MSAGIILISTPGLGTGIYTIGEAAKLLKESPGRVRGWANGYRDYRGYGSLRSGGVLVRDESEPGLLTFYDLIELCFVREFARAGVKLDEIVLAAKRLREDWGTPYPFAKNLIQTDGQQLLLEAGDAYRNVARCQQVFQFAQQFFKDIDVDASGLAKEWWPMGRNHLVVISPKRAFGAPIDVRSGTRADVLYKAYTAEKDIDAVAEWYEVEPDAVRDAVEFEEKWLKAA